MRISDWSSDVCSSDLQHAAIVVQVEVVGLERLVAHRLDHRVAAVFDPQAGVVDQLRARPVQRLRAFGQAGEHVEFARSEERRVGKECVSTCRSRWSTEHYKKNKKDKRV